MQYYPINLKLANRRCVVIGGGAVAERKALGLLAAGAEVTVISPELTPYLGSMVQEQRITHQADTYRPGQMAGFFLAICATDCQEINREAALEAKAAGVLVNVADAPEMCDFTVPAQVARGDLLLTVSTGSKSPAVAKQIRQQLEQTYGEEYGAYLEVIADLREQIKACCSSSREREIFWRSAMNKEILELLKAGRVKDAEAKILDATSSFRTKS